MRQPKQQNSFSYQNHHWLEILHPVARARGKGGRGGERKGRVGKEVQRWRETFEYLSWLWQSILDRRGLYWNCLFPISHASFLYPTDQCSSIFFLFFYWKHLELTFPTHLAPVFFFLLFFFKFYIFLTFIFFSLIFFL